MRGPNLLLAHLEAVGRLVADEEPPEPRPSGRERLEQVLGTELTVELLAALGPRAPQG